MRTIQLKYFQYGGNSGYTGSTYKLEQPIYYYVFGLLGKIEAHFLYNVQCLSSTVFEENNIFGIDNLIQSNTYS